MVNKTITINGIEVEVEDAYAMKDESGMIAKFVLKDMNYGKYPMRDVLHIQYEDFDYKGLSVMHENMIIIRIK